MTNSIPVKNIYYMLAYAYHVLNKNEFKNIAIEKFDNAEDLFAEIIILSTRKLIKQNLTREYVENTDCLTTIKGKINLTESINTLSFLNNKIYCTYDKYSSNSYLNKIIKACIILLTKLNINKEHFYSLKLLLPYFQEIEDINISSINWNIHFTRDTEMYKMIIGICHLLVQGCIQTTQKGSIKLMDFRDSQALSTLYEKFILGYYKIHFPEYNPQVKYINWQLDDQNDYLLPRMKTDIMLNHNQNYLIIDAKYYQQSIQHQFENDTAISNHLYQIFAYVKNKQYELKDNNHTVSGVLLYAKTNYYLQPKSDYLMSGNKISIDYLDLSTDFEDVKNKLNSLIIRFLS